ncbi:MAG: PD-(D/E)XK nuclease family transposase, partial [Mariprofundales bacterium]
KRPEKLQEKVFAKLFSQAEIAGYSDDEYAEYEESLKYYRDLKNSIDTAFDDGKIEGKLEGKLEGEIKGKIEGKIETAIKMQQKGYAIADIAELTGLSIEDIKKI